VAKRIELTLPEPPSANRYWRHARGRTYRSKEADAYLAAVMRVIGDWKLDSGDLSIPFYKGSVKVTATWFRSRRAGDLDNRWKIAGDALNGLLWTDDKQITELHLFREDAPKAGRIELIVEAA
jgi:crossover junction endodeoxyribonuclease RusA